MQLAVWRHTERFVQVGRIACAWPLLERKEKLCTQHLGEKTDRLLEIGHRYTEVIHVRSSRDSHLGVSKGTDLSNPVNSAALWNKATKTSRVRPYKPDEAQDSPNPIADWLPKDVDLSADGVVDPDYDDLPPCTQGSC